MYHRLHYIWRTCLDGGTLYQQMVYRIPCDGSSGYRVLFITVNCGAESHLQGSKCRSLRNSKNNVNESFWIGVMYRLCYCEAIEELLQRYIAVLLSCSERYIAHL